MTLPVGTLRAKCVFFGSSSVLLTGLLTQRDDLITLATSGLIGLALSYSLTTPLCTQLRQQRLTFRWEANGESASQLAQCSRPFRPSTPVSLQCSFSHMGSRPLRLFAVRPEVSAGLQLPRESQAIHLPVGCRTHFTLTATPAAAGLHTLHGASAEVRGPLSLFTARLYFPTTLQLKVLPRTPLFAPGGLKFARRNALAIRPPLQRSNTDGDVRELRELQPGDPFKNIAWKASARRGQLLVRTLEQAERCTQVCIVDSSVDMRSTTPARTPMDAAVEVSATIASTAVHHGQDAEVLAVDGRVVVDSGLVSRPHQLGTLQQTLLSLTRVVDSDLTSLDAGAVKERVSQHMSMQGTLPAGGAYQADSAHILQLARTRIAREKNLPNVIAVDDADAVLRKYCFAFGLNLPYRRINSNFPKAAGLMAALRRAAGPHRSRRNIILLSNLTGVQDFQALKSLVHRLRARGHRVVVGIPHDGEVPSALDDPARRIAKRAWQRRAQNAEDLLAHSGIPSTLFALDESPIAVTNRLLALAEQVRSPPRRKIRSPQSQSA